MAYLLEDEDDKKQAPEDAPNGGIAGVATSLGLGQSGTPAAPQSTGGTGSPSKFVNFDRYFNANKDAAMAGADRLAGGVAKRADAATTGLENYNTGFQSAVKSGTPVYGGETGYWVERPEQAAGTDPNNYTTDVRQQTWETSQPGANAYATRRQGLVVQPTAEQPATRPTKPDNALTRDELKAKSTTGYSGPNWYSEWDGYSKVAGDVGKAASESKALGDPRKLQGLVQQYGGATTQGGARFDTALLGAAGGQKFRDVADRYAGLEKKLAEYTTAGDAAAGVGRTDGEATKNKYLGILNDEDTRRQNLPEAGPDAFTQTKIARENEIKAMTEEGYFGNNKLGRGSLSQEPIFQGLTPELVAKMTPEEVATLKALFAQYQGTHLGFGSAGGGTAGDQAMKRGAFMASVFKKYGGGT